MRAGPVGRRNRPSVAGGPAAAARLSGAALLGVAALATAAAAAPPAREAALAAPRYAERVFERTLENGFRMILLEDHKAPVAVVQVWYRVGSRNEVPGLTGLSHMLEHMMFKGTERHGPDEYSKIIARNGGQENAFTSDDGTTYFAKLAADRIGVEIELEADRMRHLVLSEEHFEPERKVVAEERRLRVEDQPIALLFEALRAATFLEHPYRQPTIGWTADIEGWRLEDLRRHYDLYYRPNNAFLVAVGDFEAERLASEIARRFSGIPRGPEPPPVRARAQPLPGPARVEVRRPAELPFVAFSYRVPNLHSPESGALEMLEAVLAAGKSSRLYRHLVHEKRLALDVDAGYDRTAVDDKAFTVSAQPQPGVAIEELERALLEEIEALRKAPPTPEELSRARARIEAAFVFAQDSVFYRALLLGTYELAGGWRQIDDYLPAIRAVKAADVQRVAKRYLGGGQRVTAVLRPEKTAGRPTRSAARPLPGGVIR